eukprot:688313-Pleurochrysis_carterae.AAC.1
MTTRSPLSYAASIRAVCATCAAASSPVCAGATASCARLATCPYAKMRSKRDRHSQNMTV